MNLKLFFFFVRRSAFGYDDKQEGYDDKQEGELILVLGDIGRMVAVEENSTTRANRHVIYQFGNFSNEINCIFV